MATKEKKPQVKIMTPEFRASYPAVFEAKAVNKGDKGDKAKFSVQMIFRVKETPESKARGEKVVDILPLRQAVAAILVAEYGADKTKWPAGLHTPFRNGSEKKKPDGTYPAGYDDGVVFCNASTIYKPGLVDSANVVIVLPNEFYGGCYARATVNPYAYEYMGKRGVSLGLQNIQKLRDGEPFGGRTAPEDDFDAIDPPAAGAAGGVDDASDPLAGMP